MVYNIYSLFIVYQGKDCSFSLFLSPLFSPFPKSCRSLKRGLDSVSSLNSIITNLADISIFRLFAFENSGTACLQLLFSMISLPHCLPDAATKGTYKSRAWLAPESALRIQSGYYTSCFPQLPNKPINISILSLYQTFGCRLMFSALSNTETHFLATVVLSTVVLYLSRIW